MFIHKMSPSYLNADNKSKNEIIEVRDDIVLPSKIKNKNNKVSNNRKVKKK